jgi:hypothetical protein
MDNFQFVLDFPYGGKLAEILNLEGDWLEPK